MSSSRINNGRKFIAWLTLFTFVAMPLSLVAQTQIKYHNNRYSPADDVKVGRQAAQEAEQQFPLLQDETVGSYVERVGQRLVARSLRSFNIPNSDTISRSSTRATSTRSRYLVAQCT